MRETNNAIVPLKIIVQEGLSKMINHNSKKAKLWCMPQFHKILPVLVKLNPSFRLQGLDFVKVKCRCKLR